jgi:hypothetical protein
MAQGLALHIGLNAVDPAHYSGWNGALNACEADAVDMKAIADACGFKTRVLLTQDARRQPIVSFLETAAQQLQSGDILLLTYSGHGGQLPDLDGDEDDKLDETWCLYDGQLADDELHRLYARLREGVRVFVLSDSCHSGTVLKGTYYQAAAASGLGVPSPLSLGLPKANAQPPGYKYMPAPVAQRTYRQNQKFYDGLLHGIVASRKDKAANDVAASVRLISGCQDNQYSLDGVFNSAFTAELLTVWNRGNFKGNYSDFHLAIQNRLPPSQSPNHFTIGRNLPAFDRQKPFTI